MKTEFIGLMKCPYCGADLKIDDILKEKEGEIINGCVKCGCSEFSILEGILNLKIGPLNSYIVKLLRKNEVKKALRLSLWRYSEGICEIVGILGSKKLMEVLLVPMETSAKYGYRKYLKGTSFYNLLGKTPSENYLKHRFSAETLWSVYPFIPLLKTKERILDIGCGAGHTSFIISAYVKPKELVCVDRAFRNLYQAKNYFAKDAQFICLDANYPLPFKSNIFDAIFMLDAFHYISARASLAREMERLLLPQGLLLLLHLHNSLKYNPAAGEPLSPSGWINLFQQLPTKALPERNLVEDFILRNELDLAKEYSESDLNSSNAICIIGTRDKSLHGTYEEVGTDFLSEKSNLIINPIYRVNHKQDKIILERIFPSESFRREYPFTEKYLPDRYVIDEEHNRIVEGKIVITKGILKNDLRYIEDLMKKFIIINVPRGYC